MSPQKFEADSEHPMIPYKQATYSENEMKSRSKNFFDQMNKRRSVRFFSNKEVPFEVIENCIKTAGIIIINFLLHTIFLHGFTNCKNVALEQ